MNTSETDSELKKRPKVLIVMRAFLPGINYGGPVTSVAGIIDHLGEACEFRVVTLNHDFRSDEPYDLPAGVWLDRPKHRVFYARDGDFTFAFFRRLFEEWQPDFLYLQSIFCWRFTIKPILAWRMKELTADRIVVAPRGMLSQGAMSLKWWKKMPALRMAKMVGLFRGLRWHASSLLESVEIGKWLGPASKVVVAGDLRPKGKKSEAFERVKRANVAFRVVFFSRIHPKKGLKFAIEALGMVQNARRLSFDIIGPVDDREYEAQCRLAARNISGKVEINWIGAIGPEKVEETLREYDLLILPTLGENFGHVIVEAWMAGCSVLVSDQTPWRSLESKFLGFDVPLTNIEQFAAAIERLQNMTDAEREIWKDSALKFASSLTVRPKEISDTLKCFEESIEQI